MGVRSAVGDYGVDFVFLFIHYYKSSIVFTRI